MSADSRTVATDALATLGTIIDASQKRDAIHLAVEPVVAGDHLKPGQHITVIDGVALPAPIGKGLGIVDPFIEGPRVLKGQTFWFVMYPRKVTSLRHVWAHPAFKDEAEAITKPAIAPPDHPESMALLMRTADEAGISYEDLIDGARCYLRHDDYMIDGGRWEGFDFPNNFWEHFVKVRPDMAEAVEKKSYLGSFFSCSC